jgi:hypothetical protein
MANLTGSWLALRLGADPVRIDRMRKAGELYAVRGDSGEWEYPSWQFDATGKLKPAVAEFLASARKERIAPSKLTELFDRRVGLAGGERVRDLLLSGTQSISATRVIQSPSVGS